MAAAILLCICFKIKLKDGGIPDINGSGGAENPLVGVFKFDLLFRVWTLLIILGSGVSLL